MNLNFRCYCFKRTIWIQSYQNWHYHGYISELNFRAFSHFVIPNLVRHCIKNEFSIKGFCSKCNQISRKLQICLHLPKKSLMGNFIFLCSACLLLLETKINKWQLSTFNFIVLCSNQHIAISKFCSSDLHSLAFGHKQKLMYHLESCKHLHLAGRRINHLQIKNNNKNNKSTRY